MTTTDTFTLPAHLELAKANARLERDRLARIEADRIARIHTLEDREVDLIRRAVARDIDPALVEYTRAPTYFPDLPVPPGTSVYVRLALPKHAPIHVRLERHAHVYELVPNTANVNYSGLYGIGKANSSITERTWTNDLGEALLLAEERPGLAWDGTDED